MKDGVPSAKPLVGVGKTAKEELACDHERHECYTEHVFELMNECLLLCVWNEQLRFFPNHY